MSAFEHNMLVKQISCYSVFIWAATVSRIWQHGHTVEVFNYKNKFIRINIIWDDESIPAMIFVTRLSFNLEMSTSVSQEPAVRYRSSKFVVRYTMWLL